MYLVHDPTYRYKKLYTLNYDNVIRATTNACDESKPILIHNFRNVQSPQSLEEYGFSAVKLRSDLGLTEFDDPSKVEGVFHPEIKDMLRQTFPDATNVEVLDHMVRSNLSQNIYRD